MLLHSILVSLLIKQELGSELPADEGTTRGKQDHVTSHNDGPESYEEVEILQPSVYAQLDKNRRETTGENNYQKLLKNDSDYVIPNEEQTETYEKVEPANVPPGYTELDNKKRNTALNDSKSGHEDDASYQKLIPFSLR